jgi:hypothetical protein
MSELVRGELTDRPWGLTLGALALRGLTGRLVLPGDGYTIAFHDGAVVGAASKDPRDAAVRIAATSTLVTPPQVNTILKRAKGRDEIEVIVEVAKLGIEQVDRLRRRVYAQRTARTFALERGVFVVDDAPPESTTSAVDIRPIIYLGAHSHMSDERLTAALDGLGSFFRLKDGAKDDVARFGFTDSEREVMTLLEEGASIDDLVAAHPRMDRRSLLAMVYALVSSLALEIAEPPSARGRARTRGKASIPPEVAVPRTRSKINSKVSFTGKKPAKSEPPPEPLPQLELDPEPAPAPEPPPSPRAARRTDQLIAFVAIPRAPAPLPRPGTLDDAPLEEIDQAPQQRARTPTPFGALIQPRRPAK